MPNKVDRGNSMAARRRWGAAVEEQRSDMCGQSAGSGFSGFQQVPAATEKEFGTLKRRKSSSDPAKSLVPLRHLYQVPAAQASDVFLSPANRLLWDAWSPARSFRYGNQESVSKTTWSVFSNLSASCCREMGTRPWVCMIESAEDDGWVADQDKTVLQDKVLRGRCTRCTKQWITIVDSIVLNRTSSEIARLLSVLWRHYCTLYCCLVLQASATYWPTQDAVKVL